MLRVQPAVRVVGNTNNTHHPECVCKLEIQFDGQRKDQEQKPQAGERRKKNEMSCSADCYCYTLMTNAIPECSPEMNVPP